MKKAKTTIKKEPRDYCLVKHYDFYVGDSELFDVLHKAHLAIGHGGRDRMLKELSPKYKNITRHDIELYIHLCEPCHKKQKGVKKGVVVKPMFFSEFNSRCQVNLIDFQSHPDREYKFIMVYQNHLTKFVVLRALKSKRAEKEAYKLVDIFTLLGAPTILQSNSGREFANNVVSSLKEYWPTLKIVHGKPRHSQSQGSVERANQDIENMLCAWMQDEKTSFWSEGLQIVQFMKNRAFHSGIKRSPYEALFGYKARVGLSTSSLPDDVLQDVETEEEVEKIIESVKTTQQQEERRDESMQEAQLPAEDIAENAIHDGGNQNSDEAMVIEEPSISMVIENPSSSAICCVCLKENSGAHTCRKCCRNVHAICGNSPKDDDGDKVEDYGVSILCNVCFNIEKAIQSIMESKSNLEIQAKKKLKRDSDKKIPPVPLGATVRVLIPDVDKGWGDSRNLVTEDGFYRLGTAQGILKQLYAISQFTVCPKNLMRIEDVPDHEIPL
ncbi:KRAB-A domain-containing protein 2-like [Lissotriton helveticus]